MFYQEEIYKGWIRDQDLQPIASHDHDCYDADDYDIPCDNMCSGADYNIFEDPDAMFLVLDFLGGPA